MASKSPVSAVSQQRKVSSTPDAAATATAVVPTSPQSAAAIATVPFPSPQTFDFIPPLHALVSRLLSSTTSTSTAGTAATQSGSTAAGGNASAGATAASSTEAGSQSQQKQSSQQTTSLPKLNASSSMPSTQVSILPPPTGDSSSFVSSGGNTGLPPLEAKDLSTAASAVRIRIQKARAVIENLPDVDRTVDEQEEEIEELQDRISSLKSVIADFGRRASVKEGDRMDMSD